MKKTLFTLLVLLTSSLTVVAQKAPPVHFAYGVEYFPENFANVRQNPNVSAIEVVEGQIVRFVQLEKILNATERAAFEATGLRVIAYYPQAAYLVVIPQNFDFQTIERFLPLSVVPVDPEWKMARSLREPPYGEWAVRGNALDINIQVYPMLSIPEGADWCRTLGFEVLEEGNQNGYLQIRVAEDRLREVAALPFVQFLELIPPPAEKDDIRGRSLHRANLVSNESPLGKQYDGTGTKVLVRDDGQLGPHIDLQGRLFDYANGPAANGTHGDGVVGIIGGAGNLDPLMKGMAVGADLYNVDYIASFQDLTLPLAQNEGVTITNTSYSNGCNTGYTITTQTVEMQLFENPTLMHVFSAGNSNGQDCGYGAGPQWGNITGGHKMAKNAIATANLTADGTLVESSSRGPAHDGRLKPDISANGQGQNSLNPSNGYQVFGGTSAAAPGIAGCLAQLTHAFRTIHGVNDAPAALLKATILNTATDLGNVGPDFKFGWGHINAWRALRLLEQNNWLEGSTDQEATVTHTLQIPPNVKEAKIMLYWADPVAALNTSKALINDLDLTVSTPIGTTNFPWKLNPAPIPALLDSPATKGRDSLNNVEQVLIENPSAGAYTINVKGTVVPLGPQPYYIVWEFVYDEIKVTYPSGGEGFVPGEVERIHWDAWGNTGTFTLRYSTDGGNSFNAIASVGGDRRQFDWTVPNTVSGKVHVLVFRGTVRDTTDIPFSIVTVPQNVQVAKVCPDSMWLSCNLINDTLSYDAYLLGNKYMELQGSATTNLVGFPIQNPEAEKWVSMRASHPGGVTGRRAIALRWPGELLNCPQPNDLAVRGLVSPAVTTLASCDDSELAITIKVRNEGINPSAGATAYYQLNNDPPVAEALPVIQANDVLDFTFQTTIPLNFNAQVMFKTWVDFPGDFVNFNDTIRTTLSVVSQPVVQYFIETFESSPPLPLGWLIQNPDDAFTWTTTNVLSAQVIGSDGSPGRSLFINFFNYGPGDEGEEDYLYMVPIDLINLENPLLAFDVAYARFSAAYYDAMRIEVFEDCNLSATPAVIWSKTNTELATTMDATGFYVPSNAGQWRKEVVNLEDFAGKKIVIRFVAENGYGNALYLDNIGIIEEILPVAAFDLPDFACRLDTVTYEASPNVNNPTYQWVFGAGAMPSSAFGQGPHKVVYLSAGTKNVRLTVTTSIGVDELIQPLTVTPLALANFTSTQNGLSVSFTNTSTNADTYLWEFGDGMTSDDPNPTHIYLSPGVYQVTLTATNDCRSHIRTATVGVTSVSELEERVGVNILPNPTAGDFAVELNSQISGKLRLNLFDASGRSITVRETTVTPGLSRVAFENLKLPKGMYQLNIQADGKQATFNIAVQ